MNHLSRCFYVVAAGVSQPFSAAFARAVEDDPARTTASLSAEEMLFREKKALHQLVLDQVCKRAEEETQESSEARLAASLHKASAELDAKIDSGLKEAMKNESTKAAMAAMEGSEEYRKAQELATKEGRVDAAEMLAVGQGMLSKVDIGPPPRPAPPCCCSSQPLLRRRHQEPARRRWRAVRAAGIGGGRVNAGGGGGAAAGKDGGGGGGSAAAGRAFPRAGQGAGRRPGSRPPARPGRRRRGFDDGWAFQSAPRR